MKSFSDKLSSFFLSFIFLAIIVSFAFTGFESIGGSSSDMATVDGTPVTREEYNQALNMEIQRASQGKSLTNKQIREMRLRQTTMQRLIDQKHILNFANSLGIKVSQEEIKEEIKSLPYFKTGNSFDVNRYKQLLAANKLTPAKFEEQIIEQIKTQKLQKFLSAGLDSNTFVKERMNYQNQEATAWVISFAKEEMTKNISVSKVEISKFISDEKNGNVIDSLYKTYAGKAAFEKKDVAPLEKVRSDLVKAHLQKTKRKELAEVISQIKGEVKTAMESGKISNINRLQKKFGLTFEKETKLTPLYSAIRNADFKTEQLLPLFQNKDLNTILEDENQTHVTLVRVRDYTTKEIKDEDLQRELQTSKQFAFFTIQSAILSHAKKNSKVKIKANLN